MTTDRHVYRVDPNNPGSDLAREIAATMAAASIVFQHSNPSYASELLRHAYQLDYLGRNGDAMGGAGWTMAGVHSGTSSMLGFRL